MRKIFNNINDLFTIIKMPNYIVGHFNFNVVFLLQELELN